MRFLALIITVPIAVAAVLFAISNRDLVTLSLWPLPFTLQAPLYLATLLALVVGFVAGGIVAWNAQRRHRRRARRASDRVSFLERELKETQARAAAAEKRLAEQNRPVSGPALPAVTAPASTAPTVH
ncbi:lipopolysaccharide assembly protein LapA domain-containing protein [Azospirillum sp. sgz302134]